DRAEAGRAKAAHSLERFARGGEPPDPGGTGIRTPRGKPPQRWAGVPSPRIRPTAPAAGVLVNPPAGNARPSRAACPAHIGEKSPEPCGSALARSGASAPAASGNSGATSEGGPISRLTRLIKPRAGRPGIRLVSAVPS